MIPKIFLGLSLIGSEWVLYFLLGISVLSIALIVERIRFYRAASDGLTGFRNQVRLYAKKKEFDQATQLAQSRNNEQTNLPRDLETEMAYEMLAHDQTSPEILSAVAHDSVIRAKINWDRKSFSFSNHWKQCAICGPFWNGSWNYQSIS
jgi:biopolymer transport protein ExbB/TolQ